MTSDETNYGTLYDYATDEPIRPATREELRQSLAAAPFGVIEVDGRSVYVDGES